MAKLSDGSNPAASDAAADQALLDRLTAVLAEASLYVAAELDGDTLVLSGQVDSENNRQAALDVATALAASRGLRVDDAIAVEEMSPDTGFLGDATPEPPVSEFAYADPDANPDAARDPGFILEPDFTTDIGTTDGQDAAADAIPYFPPTDPVVRPSADAEALTIIGGFSATAMDDPTAGAAVAPLDDEELAQIVLRELREDAQTTDLAVQVAAVNGVVILRGTVPSLDDADAAESVAGRIDGVDEVREELTIAGLAQVTSAPTLVP